MFLLYPVPGALQQMHTLHPGADLPLHTRQTARTLVDTPVAGPGDEAGRHVDGAPGKELEFGLEARINLARKLSPPAQQPTLSHHRLTALGSQRRRPYRFHPQPHPGRNGLDGLAQRIELHSSAHRTLGTALVGVVAPLLA